MSDPRREEFTAEIAPSLDEVWTMLVALVDAPHSLLITGDDTTLLCDLEGDGEHLAIYVQAAPCTARPTSHENGLVQLVAPATA